MSNRRRDRRGRGLRGTLAPPESPLSRSRAEQFDELVLEAVEQFEQHWAESLRAVEFAVEEVPPAPSGDPAEPGFDPAEVGFDPPVPLGRSFSARVGLPARIVLYRRPVEARARGGRPREALVHDVLVELVAELLALEPETVDPDYPEQDGW